MSSVCAAPRQTPQPQTSRCRAAGPGSGVPCGHGVAGQLFRERAWPSQCSRWPLCRGSQSRGSPGDSGDTKQRNDGTWPALGLFIPSLSPLQPVVAHPLSAAGPAVWSGPEDTLAGPLPICHQDSSPEWWHWELWGSYFAGAGWSPSLGHWPWMTAEMCWPGGTQG